MERDVKYALRSRDSTVVTLTKLRAGLLRNRGSNPGSSRTLISSLKHPEQFSDPPYFILDTGDKLVGAYS